MNSVANCTQAIGNETDKSAGAREIDWRHLAHHPDNHGERQNGDERDRDDALKPLVAENRATPMISGCERETQRCQHK
jgi:hypothetical protein